MVVLWKGPNVDRVPVSVSEWLLGSFVLILYLSNSTNFHKYWVGNAVYHHVDDNDYQFDRVHCKGSDGSRLQWGRIQDSWRIWPRRWLQWKARGRSGRQPEIFGGPHIRRRRKLQCGKPQRPERQRPHASEQCTPKPTSLTPGSNSDQF